MTKSANFPGSPLSPSYKQHKNRKRSIHKTEKNDQKNKEKHDKNADISTVNTAVLPSLSDTISLSCSTVYSESSSHPSSESSTSCSLSTAMKSRFIYPLLQKISRCIFTDMNIKTKQQEVIKLSPFIGRMLVLKPV